MRVDEKQFEIVVPSFSNAVGKFRKLFSCLNRVRLRKVS